MGAVAVEGRCCAAAVFATHPKATANISKIEVGEEKFLMALEPSQPPLDFASQYASSGGPILEVFSGLGSLRAYVWTKGLISECSCPPSKRRKTVSESWLGGGNWTPKLDQSDGANLYNFALGVVKPQRNAEKLVLSEILSSPPNSLIPAKHLIRWQK